MNVMETLKNIDIDKFAEEYEAQCRQNIAAKEAFWDSSLCLRMIYDMITCKKEFDSDMFGYQSDKVREQYGWNDISTDDIDMFINVMSCQRLGMPENFNPEEDDDCMFENSSFVKKGIHVFMMSGQGTFIRFTPESMINSQTDEE